MNVRLRNSKHLFAGLIFFATGISALVLSSNYSLGTATNMAPGYFPTILGIVLVGIGGLAIVQSLVIDMQDPVANLEFVPLFFLISSVVAFGLLIESAGLVVSTFVLVALSSYSRLFSKPLEILIIAAALSILCVGIFVYGIKLPMKAF